MGICRVFELPDGSVRVTSPAPDSRGIIEHPYEHIVYLPTLLTVQEHNAAIAAETVAIIREHPEMNDIVAAGYFRAEAVTIESIESDESSASSQGEMRPGATLESQRIGVTVRVVFLLPEPEDVWLERVFVKTVAPLIVDTDHPEAERGEVVEVDTGDGRKRRMVALPNPLAGLPFHDIDPSTLPPRNASCVDGCGEEHSVRDTWRIGKEGGRRIVTIDPKARNIHAEIRHLIHAEEHALAQDDGAALVKIAAAREMFKRHVVDGGAAPHPDLVKRLTKSSLEARRRR